MAVIIGAKSQILADLNFRIIMGGKYNAKSLRYSVTRKNSLSVISYTSFFEGTKLEPSESV